MIFADVSVFELYGFDNLAETVLKKPAVEQS